MRHIRKFPVSLLLCVVCLGGISGRAIAEPRQLNIPEPLRPWVEWVRERNPQLECVAREGGPLCAWSGALSLALTAAGGTFEYAAHLDADDTIALPGDSDTWPLSVTISSASTVSTPPLAEREGRPMLLLSPGDYQIKGTFQWSELPESIQLPATLGVLKLTVNGAAIERPRIDGEGKVLIKDVRDELQAEESSLDIVVHRKLADGVPFRVVTHLELRISGEPRPVTLGQVLPPNLSTVAIVSPLRYQMNDDGTLTLQVRPGEHHIYLESLASQPPAELTAPANQLKEWPTEEVWVWAPNEALRSVEVSGAPAIDPSRVNLPDQWRGLATYLISGDAALTFATVRRGEENVALNSLTLHRDMWLDLDGGGFTVRDTMNGTVRRDWRLNMAPGTMLGRVTIGGSDQLITKDPAAAGKAGVEVRESALQLQADSRITGAIDEIPAVSWEHDVNQLSASIHLPPGWTLFESTGPDRVTVGWLSRWSLLDLFIVILISIATWRVVSMRAGLLMMIFMVLAQDQAGSPYQVWMHLLAALALLKVLPQGTFRKVVWLYFCLAVLSLILIVLRFALSQLQIGLFPQITDSSPFGAGIGSMMAEFLIGLASVGIVVGGGILFFIYLFSKRWKYAFLTAVGSFAALALIPMFIALDGLRRDSFEGIIVGGAAPPNQYAVPHPAEMQEEQTYDSAGSYLDSEPTMERAKSAKLHKKLSLQKIDPNAALQTGPGVPNWSWRRWSLNWNGPVEHSERVRLYLLSPGINLILCIVRALCLLLLAGAFITRARRMLPAAAAVLCLTIAALAPHPAQAQSFPSDTLLEELETKLKEGRCAEQCTVASSLKLTLDRTAAQMEIVVSSDGTGAWPLPGPLTAFAPAQVAVDGSETAALRRDESGFLWVRIPSGTHRITVSGKLLDRRGVTFQFTQPPKHVSVEAPLWEVDGISASGSVGSSIQLTPVEKDAPERVEGEDFALQELPQWYLVTREIEISIPWTVTTTVDRLGPVDRSQIAKVKLLPGESVTTQEVKVENGEAEVTFPRGQTQISWSSVLNGDRDTIELKKAAAPNMTEVWVLQCSSIFHCAYEGLTPVSTMTGNQHVVTWRPWPGESIKISLTRPEGIPGDTVTIDTVRQQYSPGKRLLDGETALTIRSSQGGWQKLKLPAGARVQEFLIDGAPSPTQPKGDEIPLPLTPGARNFLLKWQLPAEMSNALTLPAVSIDRAAANIEQIVNISPDRWVLYSSGPAWGPVFLYWAELILILIAAVVLGRSALFSLGVGEWILLGLGLSTLPAPLMIIPPAWFFVLRLREKFAPQRRHLFNLLQLAIVALTGLTLIVFFGIVAQGLTGSPDMAVLGYGSSDYTLRWYVDRISGELPSVTVYSLPMWVWRTFMFLWAGWLVFATLRWLRRAWETFSAGGMWRSKSTLSAES